MPGGSRAFVDLHCHTRASFDSLSDPVDVAKTAKKRGLTHLAITDHDTIDGALRARDARIDGMTIIVGEEVKTAAGDLICLFLEEAVPPGLPIGETIAAVRAQGGLVGIPHPFDGYRNSLLRDEGLASLATLVDWVETHNARIMLGDGNEKAVLFAKEHGLPGVSVSDAHTLLEVAVACTVMDGDPSTPSGLLAALPAAHLELGRATFFVRLVTPVAKVVQRARGVRRVAPAAPGSAAGIAATVPPPRVVVADEEAARGGADGTGSGGPDAERGEDPS
jgi:predicted metal-dependent phosphoesterase TrpH